MFYNANLKHIASFNSDTSCKLISTIKEAVDLKVRYNMSSPHKQAFAPSSAFCDRKTWFRLRGVNPDTPASIDYYGEFVKAMGDACHIYVQSLLKEILKDDWLDVTSFLQQSKQIGKIPYTYETTQDGYETHVEISNPPIRFTVDGLVRYMDKTYVIEIKSIEHSTFVDLYEPREKDVCQTKSYLGLLNIPDVLYIYVDRVYGEFKCFEYHYDDTSYEAIVEKCNLLLQMAACKVAPEKCNIQSVCNMCEYKKRCKEW